MKVTSLIQKWFYMTQRQPIVLHKTLGPPDIRISNRAGLLEAIRRNHGISRAELVDLTGLTQAAISNIVVELMAMGLVEEAGVITSGGGRPRVQLMINPNACYVVGVDLARSEICASVVDLNGTSRHTLRVASTLINPIDITIARLVDLLQQDYGFMKKIFRLSFRPWDQKLFVQLLLLLMRTIGSAISFRLQNANGSPLP